MDLKVAAGSVVCSPSEGDFVGDITIGPFCVVHPKARLLAEGGPIVIGEGNLIEERVVIRNRQNPDEGSVSEPLIIGSHNVFEVGCVVESRRVGDHNVFEAKSFVASEVAVGDGCVVGALCHVTYPPMLEDRSVIFGSPCKMRIQADKPALQTLQLEFLRKTLPTHHPLVPTHHPLVRPNRNKPS